MRQLEHYSSHVYIVGVGPGDPGLLTLKAHDLITNFAEVVVYDRLIPEAILAFIPESVEKIYAGKSCREHVMTQDEINETLYQQAKLGKKVVRLKGGDPFIFGRGGEEALYLAERQIDFALVPGVNAADGCAMACGVPLTHRGVATGVRFITGHQQKGKHIDHDWKGLADPMTTLVIYMGLANLQHIASELIASGLPAETPAMAVEWGTTPQQRQLKTSLDQLADEVKAEQFKAPTLIVIGQVVALSSPLSN